MRALAITATILMAPRPRRRPMRIRPLSLDRHLPLYWPRLQGLTVSTPRAGEPLSGVSALWPELDASTVRTGEASPLVVPAPQRRRRPPQLPPLRPCPRFRRRRSPPGHGTRGVSSSSPATPPSSSRAASPSAPAGAARSAASPTAAKRSGCDPSAAHQPSGWSSCVSSRIRSFHFVSDAHLQEFSSSVSERL